MLAVRLIKCLTYNVTSITTKFSEAFFLYFSKSTYKIDRSSINNYKNTNSETNIRNKSMNMSGKHGCQLQQLTNRMITAFGFCNRSYFCFKLTNQSLDLTNQIHQAIY